MRLVIYSNICLVLILAFVATSFCWDDDLFDDNKLKCKCELKTKMLKCRTNATDVDLCFQCSTACGRQVTMVYFHNGSECMADKLIQCCPTVTNVEIDAPSMCDCYCKVKGIKISSADPKKKIDCKCPQDPVGQDESDHYTKTYGINFCNASVLFLLSLLLLIMGFVIFHRNFLYNIRTQLVQPNNEHKAKLMDGEENLCFEK